MNLGFLGLQFSFGLQQANMVPIYSWLGANEAHPPILQLAGPMTGLLIQPLIGTLSDRINSRLGRRTPYLLIGAVLCSLALFFMPRSVSIMMAASLLWLLDAGNTITMEPYRAYVSDRLDASQHEIGFLSQSAFSGLAQFLAALSRGPGAHRRRPNSAADTLREIGRAIVEMPHAMRQMAWVSPFQWFGFSIYRNYAPLSIARSLYGTADKPSAAFRDAVLATQQLGAFYNLIGFGAAFAMVPVARRLGASQVHMAALAAAGLAMLALAQVGGASGQSPAFFTALAMPELGRHLALLLPAFGLGLGLASIMGNPYVILAGSIPPERTGVYMGIFNNMIVIPMLIYDLSFGPLYAWALGSDSRHAISFAGVLLLCAAVTMIWVKNPKRGTQPENPYPEEPHIT